MTQGRKIIVIGAGIGGLAATLRLIHAGCDVLVLEAHDVPGGKIRSVPSVAGPVDTGPTVLTMRGVFDELFHNIGEDLNDHVTLIPEPLLARHFWPDGATLDLFADRGASIDAIGNFAGARAARDYRSFAEQAQRLFDAFETPIMKSPAPNQAALTAHVLKNPALIAAMAPWHTMTRKLTAQFSDPRLRQLFGRYATYVGGSPYDSPAVLSLISHAEAAGVWRVEGGMHHLASALANCAAARGADIRFGTAATQIHPKDNGALLVTDISGTQHMADCVVFNGDPRALRDGLLGDTCAKAVPERAVTPRSLSAEVWAFAATPDGADLAHHNVFFGHDPRTEFEPIAAGHAPRDPTLYVCAQDRGTGTLSPEIERFEIICNAPPLPHQQDEDFSACHQRTFQTLAKRGLTFSPEPGPESLTDPQGFDRLFPASQGSLYGRSPHGMMAAFARPTARTTIPGLYLAGGGAHPGAGVPMATLSGKHAAETILSDLSSISTSRPTDMPGGMSTASPTIAAGPSRSSAS